MLRILLAFGAGVLVLALIVSRFVYTVFPWQHALILQFGEVVSASSSPGLYFKLPWQETLYMDARILTIDSEEADRFITTEKENVLVDSFIKWRIKDPLIYYISVGGSERSAEIRLVQFINRSLRDEIGKRTVKEMVSGERSEVMDILRKRATETSSEIGIEVLDVRVKRVELPLQVSENVYRNMIEERRRVANERRASGDAEKEKIRADADKQRTIILAKAQRSSEITRGSGDAQAASIYAKVYTQHPEFYAFHRSLEAYQNSFGSSTDFLVLDPNSDFLRYFKSQLGEKSSD